MSGNHRGIRSRPRSVNVDRAVDELIEGLGVAPEKRGTSDRFAPRFVKPYLDRAALEPGGRAHYWHRLDLRPRRRQSWKASGP